MLTIYILQGLTYTTPRNAAVWCICICIYVISTVHIYIYMKCWQVNVTVHKLPEARAEKITADCWQGFCCPRKPDTGRSTGNHPEPVASKHPGLFPVYLPITLFFELFHPGAEGRIGSTIRPTKDEQGPVWSATRVHLGRKKARISPTSWPGLLWRMRLVWGP